MTPTVVQAVAAVIVTVLAGQTIRLRRAAARARRAQPPADLEHARRAHPLLLVLAELLPARHKNRR